MRELAQRRKRGMLCVLSVLAGACSLIEPEPLDPPVVNLRALNAIAMGINSQVFSATLSLYNPNTVPLNVSGGELQLELAGVSAAEGRTLAPFSVPAGESLDVDIRVTTHLLRDLPALYAALSSGRTAEGLDYALTGHLNVERRGPDRLPVSARGTLVVPQADPEGSGRMAPGDEAIL